MWSYLGTKRSLDKNFIAFYMKLHKSNDGPPVALQTRLGGTAASIHDFCMAILVGTLYMILGVWCQKSAQKLSTTKTFISKGLTCSTCARSWPPSPPTGRRRPQLAAVPTSRP